MRPSGLPPYGQMWPDVQVRHLPGEGLGPQLGPGWVIWERLYASPLTAAGTGVGPRGHTHTSPSCACQQHWACASTHTRTRSCTNTTYTHKHTQSPFVAKTPPAPPAVRTLYLRGQAGTPFLPGPHLPEACLSDPVESLNPYLPTGLSLPEAHRVWPHHVGRGRRPKLLPSQTPIPPHSHPGTTPTSSPAAPTQQGPPTYPACRPFLLTARG